jgi:hypothetical protein
MPTSQEIIEQLQKWMINGQFLEHTAYATDDVAGMLDKDEKIHGFITARAKAPEPYRGYATRWVIILTNKKLMFLSKGDGKSLYVDSVVSKWEIPIESILSVQKQKGFLTNKIIIYPYKDVIKSIPDAIIDPFFEALSDAIKNAGKENEGSDHRERGSIDKEQG